MKFKLDFEIPKHPINKEWPSFFMMGSCFAQNQAARMNESGMFCTSNPYGIVYNPFSIYKILERLTNNNLYQIGDFFGTDKKFSWEHHGDFKYDNIDEAVNSSNQILDQTIIKLQSADCIVLTFGTSLVYKHKDKVVANCHKYPNKEFTHEQLSFDEVKASIQKSIAHIKNANPTAKVILTVSPIRHLRSGVTQSSRSKAVLLSAIHEVVDNTEINYFPSYEIFMDELRDYRFAKEDLTHPTPLAEQYIWERFKNTYFTSETKAIMDSVKKYNDFKNHRPSDEQLHKMQLTEQKNKLLQDYPFIKLP